MVTLKYQERFKTAQGVFDAFTERTLFELESRGKIGKTLIPIKVGKESNVFLTEVGKKKVIVKIYRMQNCDFNRMYGYIRKDPRYAFLKSHKRHIILAWAQREYKNLVRAERLKVSAPKPIAWRNHIIVEEMIGENEPAAPLKDALPSEPQVFFNALIEEVRKMYLGGLVHGDLSAFNILNDQQKPVIIDFSQATLTKTPNVQELLGRDVENILRFFAKLGIKKDGKIILEKIQKS